MSHMSPFRVSGVNLGSEMTNSASNPKKRRKHVQTPIQTPPSTQDLLPPPLSGFSDTIVATNPFDDCPSTVNSMNIVRNPNTAGMVMGPNPNMGMDNVNNMNMCRMGMNMGSPMMQSPNSHPNPHMMMNNSMMNGPRMNHMGPGGPHMMPSPNGPVPNPMHPISGPMHSPLGNMNMGPGGGQGGGPSGPMGGPMNGGPMNNPMNGPPMPHGGPDMPMQTPNGPIGPPMNNNNFKMNPMYCNVYPKPMPVSAGKVYPADQPMVFNPQNPNAPPIYPCGVCHKEVHDNDQAILCESGCNFWFHRGCTGLTEAAFQLLTAEVYAEWVCDKCLASKNIPLVKFKP